MNNVKFDNFELLYVFIPLVLIVLIPFFIALKKKSFKFKNLFSAFLHLIICMLLSLSLSGIKTEEITTDSTTYIVADVSYTTKDVLEEMDAYINEFNEKKSVSTELGIVAFGKDSVELTKPGENIKSLSEAKVNTSATNIQQALEYTMSLFEENSKKRIVLLSDGKETDGDVLSLTEQFNAENIRIDAVYFNSDFKDETVEVQVDSLKAKTSTFKDAEDFLKVSILSSLDNVSQVIIYDNDEEIYNEILSLSKGENIIEVKTNTTETGKHNYKCEIINAEDVTIENNKAYFRQEVHGQPTAEMPSRRWNRPSIMIMGEANYSNAHGTPWVYSHLGLGKLVGMPVPGTMSSVNWVRLQDSSLVFGIPVTGYRTAEGIFLENTQLEPDIRIANDPAVIITGEDQQLKAAVEALLKDIDKK